MYKFKILAPVWHGVFGREYGDSEDNRERLGIPTEDLFFSEQAHSDKIRVVRERPDLNKHEGYDGFVSDLAGLYFLVKIADCQGVLFFDPVRRVVGVAHSGWKGSVRNILGKTVRTMRDEFGCLGNNILVGIGPSLGPCCCQFTDPHSELPGEFERYILPDNKVDFWKSGEDQLTSSGILAENIENMRTCTVCNSDRFFSYRKDGSGHGRNGVIIGLT